MEECVFCKIVKGDIPSYKIYGDTRFMAFLDIFPNIKGQSLVIPKAHYDSYVFDLDDKALTDFIVATKKVARILEKGLEVGRVHMVLEGTGVNHLYAKLYPAIGMGKGFKEFIAEEKVHFDSYRGYVTTLMGPKAEDKDLREVLEKVTKRR